MESALVSIIMPVFNGERYLAQAIESVINQTYPHWELVVVDDGSTDNTAPIVKTYSDSRIRYTHQENRGQTAALNRGLELARGDYITTLDADDWLPATSLSERVNLLQQHPEFGVVYGDGFYCSEAGEPVLQFSKHMPTGVSGDVYGVIIVSPFYGTGATVLVRRQILNDHQIRYDESIVWCQDWDFYIRLAEKTAFGFVESATIYYRLHEAGMTLTMPKGRRLESLIRLRYKVLASARFNSVSTAQKSAFFYDFLLKDLQDRLQDQINIIESNEFRALPDNEQARLLRLVAIDYLLQNKHNDQVRQWLQKAWGHAPLDPKTSVVAMLSALSLNLARLVTKLWQSRRQPDVSLSPFELALASK